MTPKDFIDSISPATKSSMAATGIPASFVIAEAALESAWGRSRLAIDGHNLFGVKADKAWHGDVLTMNTREYLHGEWVMAQAKWRKYADWLGAITDHAAFLMSNPRYKKAFECKTGPDFAHAVAEAGYATDPEYAAKLCSIIRVHDLEQYDHV